MPLLLLRLGARDYADGHKKAYMLLDDQSRVEDIFAASNEDEAVAHGRERASDGVVECEPALAAVAQRRRASTRPLTLHEQRVRAHRACSLHEKDAFRNRHSLALLDFFAAASLFARAAASDARQRWLLSVRVRGTLIDAPVDRRFAALVMPGAEPMVYLVDPALGPDVLASPVDVEASDHLGVSFHGDNLELIEFLDEAYELRAVAVPTVMEASADRGPRDDELVLLAVVMRLIAGDVTDGFDVIRFRPRIGGELEVEKDLSPATPPS